MGREGSELVVGLGSGLPSLPNVVRSAGLSFR